MKRYKILINVLKRTGAINLLYGYLLTLLIISVAIVFIEPNINTLQDGFWYSFNVLTTIGFGDVIATTLLGRILTILLSIYSILIIAVIPGLITSFYLEIVKLRTNESLEKFMYDLERLPDLTREELENLSEKVRGFQKK